ncbi:hypothetical protein NDU88_004985 [Pleurodeles waltl]|uniref:Uncharacterized protein n=1 Tax=Pleurodeles waltl TaxID=8319 RepID=A0AAV7PE61_PLEWA|nr:hypothetical protein NDU88_004985 [Pleurodeles waltl]
MVRARQAVKKNLLAGSRFVDVARALLSNTDPASAVCCGFRCIVEADPGKGPVLDKEISKGPNTLMKLS